MVPTKTPSQRDFDHAVTLVEATIQKLGLDPAALRIAVHGPCSASWTLKRGSASVLVTVSLRDEERAAYLRVAAPLAVLPVDPMLQVRLFRRLLELNAAGLANAAFGLVGDKVVAVSERPAQGLSAEEVEQSIRHLAAVADTFDDRLVKEFGATRA